ncbi:MAG: polysaccharide pyruvyl transferase family protein [Bacilli bacterium]|jgi:hypothetical protein|nr:polysaccharide pyruvyl transferase family protein [Bacilli bacterium]
MSTFKGKRALITSLGSRSTCENYGAVLQMLAFCWLLKENYRIEPTVLDYIGINCQNYTSEIVVSDFLYNKGVKGKIKKIIFGNSVRKRFIRNLRFIKKNVNVTSLFDYKTIKGAHFDFDCYFAESDVIWDPTFRGHGFDDTFFLPEAIFSNGKKFVYGAGVGDCSFTEEEERELVSKIKQIDRVSVREKYAKQAIQRLLHVDIPCVLDPTLMVNTDFYSRFIKDRRPIKKKYALVYSPAFQNKKMLSDAYKFAKKKGLHVLIIKREFSKAHFFDTRINVDVERFLNLLFYCDTFFCDSFHGVCLSVMFKKQFYVYNRENGRKIKDICNRLSLEKNIVNNDFHENNIDYDLVYDNLKAERQASFDFLDSCLEEI